MKTQLQIVLSAGLLILFSTILKAQYTTSTYVDELRNVVNMDQFHDPFSFVIKYAEAPHPVGKKG